MGSGWYHRAQEEEPLSSGGVRCRSTVPTRQRACEATAGAPESAIIARRLLMGLGGGLRHERQIC